MLYKAARGLLRELMSSQDDLKSFDSPEAAAGWLAEQDPPAGAVLDERGRPVALVDSTGRELRISRF